MSADFVSDVRIESAASCARWYTELAAREVIAALDPGIEHGLELGPTYVDLDVDTWMAYCAGDAPSATHLSSNYASLVVLDRGIAIPRGGSLLAGHAVRRVRTGELEAFARDWRGLVLRAGGVLGLARLCRPWLDRGGFDVDELAEFLEAIGTLAAQARTQGDELLLAGYPVP